MPRFPAGATRDGWQIVRRDDGYWLQVQIGASTWQDYSGPYRQRGSALERYRRMELYALMDARHDPHHVHRFPAPGTAAPAYERRCIGCGLTIEEEQHGV